LALAVWQIKDDLHERHIGVCFKDEGDLLGATYWGVRSQIVKADTSGRVIQLHNELSQDADAHDALHFRSLGCDAVTADRSLKRKHFGVSGSNLGMAIRSSSFRFSGFSSTPLIVL
jgi:hypothetical protein